MVNVYAPGGGRSSIFSGLTLRLVRSFSGLDPASLRGPALWLWATLFLITMGLIRWVALNWHPVGLHFEEAQYWFGSHHLDSPMLQMVYFADGLFLLCSLALLVVATTRLAALKRSDMALPTDSNSAWAALFVLPLFGVGLFQALLDFWHKTRYWPMVLRKFEPWIADQSKPMWTSERDVFVQITHALRHLSPVLLSCCATVRVHHHFDLFYPTPAHGGAVLWLDRSPPPLLKTQRYTSRQLATSEHGGLRLELWLLTPLTDGHL